MRTVSQSAGHLAVGISLCSRDGLAIWENGIHQNIAFVAMMLKRLDRVGPVYFLNGGDANALPAGLDLVRQHEATFEPRLDLPGFTARHADAVVSNHWKNGQNYLYYDVLYGGYPLIHNLTLIGDAGYYYLDFDAAAGDRALLQAFAEHDANLDAYREQSKHVLDSVSIYNPENVASYSRALISLFYSRTGAKEECASIVPPDPVAPRRFGIFVRQSTAAPFYAFPDGCRSVERVIAGRSRFKGSREMMTCIRKNAVVKARRCVDLSREPYIQRIEGQDC
ncbi:putative DUF2827 domain-containing protein [Burkholderia cepacia]